MPKHHEELQPDEDALQAWENLPKQVPTRSSLPPATGGVPRWLWGLIVVMLAFGVVVLILQMIGVG